MKEPQYVMKCPACRYGKVYRYEDRLECERCKKIAPVTDEKEKH